MASATYRNGLSFQLQNYMLPVCNTQMIPACVGFCTVGGSHAFPAATLHNLPSLARFLDVLAWARKMPRSGVASFVSKLCARNILKCRPLHSPILSSGVDIIQYSEKQVWQLGCYRARRD